MPAARTGAGVVAYRPHPGIDAIDQYSRHLVAALRDLGTESRYLPGPLVAAVSSGAEPAWVLLQYQPFAWGHGGFAPGLLRDAHRVRRSLKVPLVVMVHETWLEMTDWRSAAMGMWQRGQLGEVLRLADGVMASTEATARALGGGATHVPVAANIAPVSVTKSAARAQLGLDGQLTVALFGRGHPTRALDHAEAAISALAEAHGPERLLVLNLGAGAPTLRVPRGVEVTTPGPLGERELSVRLRASDVALLPFTDGVSTRRGTLMAALAHGLPVLGSLGRNTDDALAHAPDALALSPAGDRAAFARAAVELSADPERLQTLGEAGRRLYAERFDWPITARRVAGVIAAMRESRRATRRRAPAVTEGATASEPSTTPKSAVPRLPREVAFVIHDLGGPGGMELHAEELITRLLEAGIRVTVVARTCRLERHDSLRFVRVRTPARPFVLAYPAFFAVASLLLARRRHAVIHTTGAIVANRVDVSTVHYCHHAEGVHARASRPGRMYRVNAEAAAIMSRAAESWCYRAERTRVLCAVSAGVKDELRFAFPAAVGNIRVVPNGVDPNRFRPDPEARRAVRAELGFGDTHALALFVGGDWERKGLRFAIEALSRAPGWRLVVAGPGDPEPLVAGARAAGTADRVQFLGRVSDMPRLYAAADAFVMPTSYEAFPLAVLEAAASGLPLIVTRVNGVEDLVEHGRNGWFVERSGADIATCLNELASDPALAVAMADAARDSASRFSWGAMGQAYARIYGELATEG